jgi:gliding motility-associated-like protein
LLDILSPVKVERMKRFLHVIAIMTLLFILSHSAKAQVIIAGPAIGTISACEGTPSSRPNILQFNIAGVNLSANIIVAAPTGFEVSLVSGSGFADSLPIIPSGGVVNSTAVYVRSAASAAVGFITGYIKLTSSMATPQSVVVTASVRGLATVNQVPSQTFFNGAATAAVNFTGTAVAFYTWVNSNPAIGLGASGIGNIPSFTAVNNGNNLIIDTITVTPTNASGCNGPAITFTITINPGAVPIITPTGPLSPLSTIYGTYSTAGKFNVSGVNLPAGILVTVPAGFEVSADSITFRNAVTIGTGGTIASTPVYIRLKATAAVGSYGGNILLSSNGTVNTSIVMPASLVTRAQLTVTADNKSKTFDMANPALTITYSGFVNNDGPAQLTTPPGITTTAVTTSPVGQYPITVFGAASANYTFVYVAGVLTIDPAPIVISVPNAFTPNGDGINDTWDIKYLNTYASCTVEVFNRFGASIYFSNGYPAAWDGRYKGADLPVGTYYYVINLGNGSKQISGYVTIIR